MGTTDAATQTDEPTRDDVRAKSISDYDRGIRVRGEPIVLTIGRYAFDSDVSQDQFEEFLWCLDLFLEDELGLDVRLQQAPRDDAYICIDGATAAQRGAILRTVDDGWDRWATGRM